MPSAFNTPAPSDTDYGALVQGANAYNNQPSTQDLINYLTSPSFDYMKRTHEATPVEQAGDAVVNTAANLAPEVKGVGLAMAGVFPRGFWKAGGEGFEKLLQLNAKGLSQKEIAAHFGIKQSSVSEAMANAGITPAKPVGAAPTWSQEHIDHLTAGVQAGKSFGDIADELGKTRNQVAGKANRLGLVGQSAPAGAPTAPQVKTPGLPDISPEEMKLYSKIIGGGS